MGVAVQNETKRNEEKGKSNERRKKRSQPNDRSLSVEDCDALADATDGRWLSLDRAICCNLPDSGLVDAQWLTRLTLCRQ